MSSLMTNCCKNWWEREIGSAGFGGEKTLLWVKGGSRARREDHITPAGRWALPERDASRVTWAASENVSGLSPSTELCFLRSLVNSCIPGAAFWKAWGVFFFFFFKFYSSFLQGTYFCKGWENQERILGKWWDLCAWGLRPFTRPLSKTLPTEAGFKKGRGLVCWWVSLEARRIFHNLGVQKFQEAKCLSIRRGHSTWRQTVF